MRDNIICRDKERSYGSIFVVSAYSGITNRLLEHKRAATRRLCPVHRSEDETAWRKALQNLRDHLYELNAALFDDAEVLAQANHFIERRLADTERVLDNLQALCDTATSNWKTTC